MDLYFSPLACSLASRIAFYEAGVSANFIEVDPKAKRTADGGDFLDINPLGLVPTIRSDDQQVLTENAAILQYIARRFPDAKLAPTEGWALARLQQWLCFIGTELHKGLFSALLDSKAPEAAKLYVREQYLPRLDLLQQHLEHHSFLLAAFSVADAYLLAVLNWSAVTAIDLKQWPAVHAYTKRLRERPSVAKAMLEERELYMREQARQRTG